MHQGKIKPFISFHIYLAWESLGNPVKRRAYDSIDPLFDNIVPGVNSDARENFYETFRPIFERNERYDLTYCGIKDFSMAYILWRARPTLP